MEGWIVRQKNGQWTDNSLVRYSNEIISVCKNNCSLETFFFLILTFQYNCLCHTHVLPLVRNRFERSDCQTQTSKMVTCQSNNSIQILANSRRLTVRDADLPLEISVSLTWHLEQALLPWKHYSRNLVIHNLENSNSNIPKG